MRGGSSSATREGGHETGNAKNSSRLTIDSRPDLAKFLSGWRSEIAQKSHTSSQSQDATLPVASSAVPTDKASPRKPQSPTKDTPTAAGRGRNPVVGTDRSGKRPRVEKAKQQPPSGHHSHVESQEDLVQALIDDLDDDNEIPMLDVVLPRDVALRILASLDVITLCRISCVSRLWRDLASDNVLWFNICRVMQYRGEIPGFTEVADWKSRVASITLCRREIDRRWKSMEAAFTNIEHYRDEGWRSAPLNAVTYSCDGGCAAGYMDGTVIVYGTKGAAESAFYAGEGRGITTVEKGGCVLAAAAVTVNGVGEIDFSHPNDTQTLYVWGAHNGGNPLLEVGVPSLDAWARIQIHSRDPTVYVATRSSLQCYSAASSGMWERMWSSVDVGTLLSIESVRDTALACLSTNGVVVRDCATGAVSATLYNSDEVGGTCHVLARGNGHILFEVADAAMNRAVVHVYDEDSAAQVGSLGTGAISSITTSPSDLNLVAVTAASQSSVHTSIVRLFDLRTETAVQTYRDNRAVGGLCATWESWRLAVGGRAGNAGTVAVFDRRMQKRLWYIDLAQPIQSVHISRDGATLWASSTSRSGWTPASRGRVPASCLTTLDFAAPPAALAEASCPFSSSFDNVQGHRYDELLAAPYDDVANPDALGP
eukprot:m.457731 g.457731  ORF g.457731 m.457731 type:complete len:653 (-) comp21339_c0_seq1:58-2016(-)